MGVLLEPAAGGEWAYGEWTALEDVAPGGVFRDEAGEWWCRGVMQAREASGRVFWQCLGVSGPRAGWLALLDGRRRVRPVRW